MPHVKIKDIKKMVDEAMEAGYHKNNGHIVHIANVMIPNAGRELISSAPIFSQQGFIKVPTDLMYMLQMHAPVGRDYHLRTPTVFESMPIIEETVHCIGNHTRGLNLYEFLPLLADGKQCFFNVNAKGMEALKELLGNNVMTNYTEISEAMWSRNLKEAYPGTEGIEKIPPRKKFGHAEIERLKDNPYLDSVVKFNGRLNANIVGETIHTNLEKFKAERFQTAS